MDKALTLIDICDDLGDGLHAAPEFSQDGEYLFVNAQNLRDGYIIDIGNEKRAKCSEWEKYKIDLNERTIIYSIDGTIGNMARYRGEKCILGKGACYIKLNKSVDDSYIYYLLRSPLFEGYLRTMQTGSTIHHISLETMSDFPLPNLPPLDSQILIGKLLADIDDKIANNSRIMKELEDTARLVYDYWFTQFDFPDGSGKPYRSSGGKMVWSEGLKREIPTGWTVVSLGEVCDTKLGGTPDTTVAEYWDGDMPWLSSAEVAVSPVLSSDKRITKRGIEESATSFAPSGSIMLSITRYIRPSLLMIDACFNQSVVAILETKELRREYLFPVIQTMVPRFLTLRTGAQQPHINKETVDESRILVPPPNVLTNYYEVTRPIYSAYINAAKENEGMAQLRDWLLPMLVTGQAQVSG